MLSWSEPVAVSFPLDAGSEEMEKSVEVDELLLVEFYYKDRGIAWDTIDISNGERDYISSFTRFTPRERIEPQAVGEVVKDSQYQHPATFQQFRIVCEAA